MNILRERMVTFDRATASAYLPNLDRSNICKLELIGLLRKVNLADTLGEIPQNIKADNAQRLLARGDRVRCRSGMFESDTRALVDCDQVIHFPHNAGKLDMAMRMSEKELREALKKDTPRMIAVRLVNDKFAYVVGAGNAQLPFAAKMRGFERIPGIIEDCVEKSGIFTICGHCFYKVQDGALSLFHKVLGNDEDVKAERFILELKGAIIKDYDGRYMHTLSSSE